MKEKGTEILAMLKEMALDAVDVLKRPVSKSELMAAEGSVKRRLKTSYCKVCNLSDHDHDPLHETE